MKKFLIPLFLAGVLLAIIVPPACGRKGPEEPPDLTPPSVSFTSPGYGEQDVPVNTTIAATFNEPVDPSTINSRTVALSQSGTAVSGTLTYSGKTAVFTPDANLSPNSVHTLAIDIGIKDIAGNPMAAPYFCTFTTGIRTVETGTHTVTPVAGPNGGISPNTPQTVTHNTTVSFTVMPDAEYSVASVTGCEGSLSENKYTTGPILADCTVTANFSGGPVGFHTITATAETGGSISPSGAVSVDHGASQWFTIAPDHGYTVETVLVDGKSVGAVSSYTFSNVTADHSIKASFEKMHFTITATAEKGGHVSCTSTTVDYGGNSFCTIIPDAGFEIEKVVVDGKAVGAVPSYEFVSVTASHKIKALFDKDD